MKPQALNQFLLRAQQTLWGKNWSNEIMQEDKLEQSAEST